MSRTYAGALMLALCAVAACGDDDPTDIIEGDALTEVEAAALAEVVAGTVFATYDQGPATAPALVSGTYQIEGYSFECEFGGNVDVSGSYVFDINEETGDGTLTFNVTQDHNDCGAESQDGILFTLNGSPHVTSNFTLVTDGDFLGFDGGFEGAVSFETEDKSGTCSLDVSFSLDGDVLAQTGSASINGRVCGIDFIHSLSLS